MIQQTFIPELPVEKGCNICQGDGCNACNGAGTILVDAELDNPWVSEDPFEDEGAPDNDD